MKFDAHDYQKYTIEFIKAWLIVIRPVLIRPRLIA